MKPRFKLRWVDDSGKIASTLFRSYGLACLAIERIALLRPAAPYELIRLVDNTIHHSWGLMPRNQSEGTHEQD